MTRGAPPPGDAPRARTSADEDRRYGTITT